LKVIYSNYKGETPMANRKYSDETKEQIV